MPRHTTHWSVAGALHRGAVRDCAQCAAEHLASVAHTWPQGEGHGDGEGHCYPTGHSA